MWRKEVMSGQALGSIVFYLLAVLMGIIAGLGAVVFRGMISIFHNVLFLGRFSVSYDANIHTAASPWGPLVILMPVLAAVGVTFLVQNLAPEAKGHGVPEVMDAIYYNKGIIRPVVAAVKSFASALSIGSGGAVGREGPIIQIGSSFGSSLGQLLELPVWQRATLVAAGAGGGIAATFNTPIGGVLFAVELMLAEVSVRTLVPVAISTATATYIGRIFFGLHPSFIIPAFQKTYFRLTNPWLLLTYVGLGIIMGVASTLFIKSIYRFEDFFEDKVPGNAYTRHMLGMLLVGATMYVLLRTTGHYYIEGVGYSTVQDVLTGASSQMVLLLVLFVLKLLATSVTLGSGASGGIFSPSLFLGATLGGAYGLAVKFLFPHISISPPAFAVAGMAGVVAGATGAALAAIVMIFEMTLDYNVIIPMTITVALSYGIRRMLSKESIYTLKLARRGRQLPQMLHADLHYLTQAAFAMQKRCPILPARCPIMSADQTLEECAHACALSPEDLWFVVADGTSIVGVISKAMLYDALQAEAKVTLAEIASRNYITAAENTSLYALLKGLFSQQASVALILANKDETTIESLRGIVTKEQIADSMAGDVEMSSLWSE